MGSEMNAKELIEAATHVRSLKGCISNKALAIADYILATVKPDDDESITPEWLHALFHDSNSAWWYLDHTKRKVVMFDRGHAEVVFSSRPFAISDSEYDVSIREVETKGQFRALCRGLGIELKEGN